MFALIGCFSYFGFGFMTLNQKVLYLPIWNKSVSSYNEKEIHYIHANTTVLIYPVVLCYKTSRRHPGDQQKQFKILGFEISTVKITLINTLTQVHGMRPLVRDNEKFEISMIG